MATAALHRVIAHVADGRRRVIDPEDVYFLEALPEATRLRLRRARPVIDVRRFGQVVAAFEAHGFFRINREHAVNLRYIHEIRRRKSGRDWEIKLAPPVNRILPVSRSTYPELLRAADPADRGTLMS